MYKCDPIQQKVHLVYFWKNCEIFKLSDRRFNNLSNSTKVVKIEGILLEIQHFQSQSYFLFILHTVLSFSRHEYDRLLNKMSLCNKILKPVIFCRIDGTNRG